MAAIFQFPDVTEGYAPPPEERLTPREWALIKQEDTFTVELCELYRKLNEPPAICALSGKRILPEDSTEEHPYPGTEEIGIRKAANYSITEWYAQVLGLGGIGD